MDEKQNIDQQQPKSHMMKEPNMHSDKNDLSANEPLHEDKTYYTLLAKMAHKRRTTQCPDTNNAWIEFRKQENMLKAKRSSAHICQICLAALSGAAAMLIGVLLYEFVINKVPNKKEMHIIAMTYDERPQQIILQDDNQLYALSPKDSLFYQSDKQVYTPQESTSKQQSSRKGKMQKLSTPRGMDFKVILPDGSEVWLNAESSLEFPAAFTEKERRVNLTGEAYFKVAHNEQCPFIVSSEQMQVRVLGTEFNFKSYSSETSHVSLINGSVEVFTPNATHPNTTLKPGQDAWIDSSGRIQVREVDTYSVCQWINGFFYFDNHPLVDILRELGRWYNLGVIFRNPKQMDQRLHFSASRNENINQAIESLNRLRKVHIYLEGTNLIVD